MKFLPIVSLIVLINTPNFCQSDFGLKINAGISNIKLNNQSVNSVRSPRIGYSGQLGVYSTFSIGRKSYLGTEALYIIINGGERLRIESTDAQGIFTGDFIISDVKRSLSYIGIPLYYGLNFDKWSFNIGVRASLLLASSGSEKGEVPLPNGEVTTFSNETDMLNIDSFDFGLRFGMNYKISDIGFIEGNFFHGIKDLQETKILRKTYQATLGLKYRLFQKNQDHIDS